MKGVLAVLAGLIVGVLVIFLTQALEMLIFPPPPNFDPNDPIQLKELMIKAPTMALVIVIIGYFLGAFIGGYIANIIIKGASWMPALMVGTVLTVLGIFNLISIPHPIWFTICALVVYFAGSFISFFVYTKFKKNA